MSIRVSNAASRSFVLMPALQRRLLTEIVPASTKG
jgi:hypothetical protein